VVAVAGSDLTQRKRTILRSFPLLAHIRDALEEVGPELQQHIVTEPSRACGVDHPSRVSLDHSDVLDDRFGASPAREVFGDAPGWGVPSASAGRRP